MLRFSDLNPVGRFIIVVVAVLTFGVAAASFATSYGALYAFIRDTGLYSPQFARLWPLLLDAAFIIAQLTAILGKILRGSRTWPILTMIVTGGLTIWFNLQHAGADPGRRLAAVIPPVLMILAFETDVAIVKWVMSALGRPLDTAPLGANLGMPQPYLQTQMPMSTGSRNGHTGLEASGGEASKKAAIQAVAERLGPEELTEIGAEGVAQYLATHHGVSTTPGYVRKVLEGRTGATRNGHGKA